MHLQVTPVHSSSSVVNFSAVLYILRVHAIVLHDVALRVLHLNPFTKYVVMCVYLSVTRNLLHALFIR